MRRLLSDSFLVINASHTRVFVAIAVFSLCACLLLLGGCLKPRATKSTPDVNRIKQLLALAESLEKQGHLLKAQHQCEQALKIDPRHPLAGECKSRLNRTLRQKADQKVRGGMVMAGKGKPDAANRMFLEALQLWPMHEKALRQIGRNHPPTRTPFIRHRLERGGSLSALALKYYGNGRYYPLIAEFNLIKHDSKVKAGERLLIPKIKGLPFYTHGRSLGTLTPSDHKVAAFRAQGIALVKAEKYKKAITCLKKALRIDSKDLATRQHLTTAYLRWGQHLLDRKQYAKARNCFQKGLQIDPQCRPCRKELDRDRRTMIDNHIAEGRRLFEADRFKAAIAELEKARKLKADDHRIDVIIADAYRQKAEALCAIDEFSGAREHFKLAAQFNPRHFKAGDYESQCRDAYLEIHYSRGINYYQKGQPHAAIAAWKKVSALNPDYKAVRYNLNLARILLESTEE